MHQIEGMVEEVFLAVALVGLLHGLEPGHGWPIAMLYARRLSRPLLMGFVSSWLISAFHLISSVAVVAAYIILKSYVGFSLPYVNYIAGGALLILAGKFFFEKPKDELEEQHGHIHDDFERDHPGGMKQTHRHKHARRVFLTLWSIATVAFILGFAHEEEFALLALAVGGVDPLILMLTYASAVMVGLVGITLTAVKIYDKLEPRLNKYDYLIPKASGVILSLMAIGFILGLR
jgi:hypothetical protein